MADNTYQRRRRLSVWAALSYDIFLWIFTVVIDLFFREIHPRSTWRIPRKGPVIFVAAPHANQFLDPLLLMRCVRQDAHRRISFLIAEKSMRRKFIGWGANLLASVPVGRALDMKKPAKGKIYLADRDGDQTTIRGNGVNFLDSQYQVGGLLVLPTVNNTAANAEIAKIVNTSEIKLKKPFKGDVALKQLTGQDIGEGNGHLPADGGAEESGSDFKGTSFSVAPHVDQSAVYDAVFKRIRQGGCIGIFPEGGSHDRTDLLPLKAGLAIMALGSLAEDPDCGVTIVPVGMNYFHAHKFRSRAVVEFGAPIEINPELVDQYKDGDRRGATAKVLEIVYERLAAVTTQAPDYDTLMLIQAVRRLYNPKGKHLPLPMVIELNRRLIKGYNTYKDNPKIISLRRNVLDYNRTLFRLNIRDHQVSYAKFSWYRVVFALLYRLTKLSLLSIAVLPGLVLFSPVFIAGKYISHQKAKEALAASTVKVKARDVIATWKVLVSLALAPALDIMYTCILTAWSYTNRVHGLVPEWLPLWIVAGIGFIGFPTVCFAALRFGEIGMDIFKSIRPLVLCINPTSSNTIVKLRQRREHLQEEVNDIINELGPELFPDFDRERIVSDPSHPLHSPDRTPNRTRPATPSSEEGGKESAFSLLSFTSSSPTNKHKSDHLPRNESFSNLGSVGIFASRPGTPNRSRSRDGRGDLGGKLKSLSTIENKSNMEEVSKNLHAAMRERGRSRKSEDQDEEDGEFEKVDRSMLSSDFEPSEAKKDL